MKLNHLNWWLGYFCGKGGLCNVRYTRKSLHHEGSERTSTKGNTATLFSVDWWEGETRGCSVRLTTDIRVQSWWSTENDHNYSSIRRAILHWLLWMPNIKRLSEELLTKEDLGDWWSDPSDDVVTRSVLIAESKRTSKKFPKLIERRYWQWQTNK